MRPLFLLPIVIGASLVCVNSARSQQLPPVTVSLTASAVALESEHIASIRQAVLARCGLRDNSEDKLPWYFHYELSLELLAANFHRQAERALQLATLRRPVPKLRARMYGMWFVDYLPYYQLASTYASLGHWACADEAIRRSDSFNEIPSGHRYFENYQRLQQRIQSQRGQVRAVGLKSAQTIPCNTA